MVLANERRESSALKTDFSNQHAALVAAQGALLREQQSSKTAMEKLQGSLADQAKQAQALTAELEQEKAARQKMEASMPTGGIGASSLLLEAREAKLKHVEGQLQVLLEELRLLKVKMACLHEAREHDEALHETVAQLKEDGSSWQGRAEVAEETMMSMQASHAETVRQAVASALSKAGAGAGLPTTAGGEPCDFRFCGQPQAANCFSGRWFIAMGGKDPELMTRAEHLKAARALGRKAEQAAEAEYKAAMEGEAEGTPLPYAALTGILATLEGRMELMLAYTDIHVPKMSDVEFHSYLVSCVDLMALRKGLSWYQPSRNSHTHRGKLCDCTIGLFGRHAADAMRWSGCCGGCWSPPGHRPGWCHLRKWSSAGTLRKLNVPKGCIARARHGPTGLPSEPSFPEDVARQSASFACGRVETKELAADHAVAGGAQCGRWPEST